MLCVLTKNESGFGPLDGSLMAWKESEEQTVDAWLQKEG